MILLRPLFSWLVRKKGRLWVALKAVRIYRRLPRFAQRRVRRRLIVAGPELVKKFLAERSNRGGRR